MDLERSPNYYKLRYRKREFAELSNKMNNETLVLINVMRMQKDQGSEAII